MADTNHDLAVALQLQRMEIDIAALKMSMENNTKATEDLLKAWNTSKGSLSFIKTLAVWAAALAGGLYSLQKLLGH